MGDTKINLGSGYRKLDNFINIDNRPETNPDMVLDVTEGLPFGDDSVDTVVAKDFLEHIPIGKVVPLIEEIYRVLKPGGSFISVTPDAEHGQGAWQDPHHVSFWVENSWLYYSDNLYRGLYGIKANFEIKIRRIESQGRVFHLYVMAVKK